MKSAGLRIGEVGARSGVSLDTLRYYERRQLLPRAPRSEGGFRIFPASRSMRSVICFPPVGKRNVVACATCCASRLLSWTKG
jgi:hypothetical protein